MPFPEPCDNRVRHAWRERASTRLRQCEFDAITGLFLCVNGHLRLWSEGPTGETSHQ
jgi:hypothetical protein